MSVNIDSPSYSVKTYGCKVNTYDTGLLQKRLAMAGYLRAQKDEDPSVHILNTCAVTAEATKGALKEARRIKSKNPFSIVVVTGCSAQVDTELFAEAPGVDLVVANSHKGDLENLIKQHLRGELKEKVFKSNIFKKEDLEAGGGVEAQHTRSFVKIQDGCNSFCTFCVIPFARGKSRSLSIFGLVRKVQELVSQGVKEVVLTGVHIGDYQDDSLSVNNKLEDLVEAILDRTQVNRLRLSSLEPVELSERLVSLYRDPRMCPHFHMSIQSAQTRVLSSMKRNYTAEDVELSLNKIEEKVPGAFVGMDVIAGFPGETENEFMETYHRLESLPWTRIHVFPYSARPGTFANKIQPHWPREEICRRAAMLRELSVQRYQERAMQQVGTEKEVLLLNGSSDPQVSFGVTQDYWNVQVEVESGRSWKPGEVVPVTVSGYHPETQNHREGRLLARWRSVNGEGSL